MIIHFWLWFLFTYYICILLPSRNFNREIFTRRPEFCLLHEKLQKTCSGWKRGPLTEKYPELCASLEAVEKELSICPPSLNDFQHSDDNHQLDPVFLQLNGSLLKLRDEMYLYARDNLAVVNIYIKDAVVTKIRRDQKVSFLIRRKPSAKSSSYFLLSFLFFFLS